MLQRRYDDNQYDGQSLANGQFRHTVDIGLENSFQRGAPSRSSLQDFSTHVSILYYCQLRDKNIRHIFN